jgi:putative ATP-binding cassette transporter
MTSNNNTAKPVSIWQLLLPYWLRKENWQGWLLLLIKLILIFSVVYIAVWSNQLDGEVVDALVKREWQGLWQVLLLALSAGLLHVVITLFSSYLVSEAQHYQWRSWMTTWLVQAWIEHCRYYGIERDSLLDNADQRIAQDVDTFVKLSLTLTLSTLQVVVSTVSFSIVLWNLSGSLSFNVWGWQIVIPGYMVYLAFAYAIGSLLISHLMGRQLIGLFNHKQTVEANFRYQGMQLRENAEQIAFYNGGAQEGRQLLMYFNDVKRNWRAIIYRTCKMTLARDVYMQAGSILPTVAALPRYLSGAMSLGDLTRTTGAFASVTSNLSFFTQAYVGFAEWKAVSNRLCELLSALHVGAKASPDHQHIELASTIKAELYSYGLQLQRPSGDVILQTPEINIQLGERWLIRGPSGAGKSTLLRAIAGIWPYGEGQILLPQQHKLMFLPQRSYIPSGSLKAALCYPSSVDQFSDEQCRERLEQVCLPHLISQLAVHDRWQQKLSGGEQQRLAFARVLLQQPDFLFLDEASSGLDIATEHLLYTAVLVELPHAAIISVAHRESLSQFHDHYLDLA